MDCRIDFNTVNISFGKGMNEDTQKINPPLKDTLESILVKYRGQEIDVATLMGALAGRGYPALLVIIGLPFCFPLQIPGFSTPFGLLLLYMGCRIALGKQMHCPQFLNRKISYEALQKIVHAALYVLDKTKSFVKPRLSFLATAPSLQKFHGIDIVFLGLTLALPLPIPLTNILVAAPIVALGLGLLEDDGVFVLIGYFLTFFAVGFFGAIIWFGLGFFG